MSPRTLQHALLSVASGALYFLGFVGFDIFPLTWVCFVPILFAVEEASTKRAILLGALFGTVTNMGGYYWVVHLLMAFAGLSAPLALLGYLLLCAYQGFLLALVIGLVRLADRDLRIPPVFSLPVAFVALELAYPLLFPSYIGNSQYRFTWITQIVDVTGMLGLTALISLVNGAAYEIARAYTARRPILKARVVFPAAAFVLTVVYGALRVASVEGSLENARKLVVAIVQTNLGARDKADMRDEFIRRHRTMTQAALVAHPEIDLVVWPESAYNSWIARDEKNLRARVTDGIDKPIIFGALTYRRTEDPPGREIFNTAVLTSSTGDVLGLYDKIELLAFGETLPFIDWLPSLKGLLPTRGSFFSRGSRLAPLSFDGVRLLPMICYEDILPGLVRKLWRASPPPVALVNVTNDSWYGDTHEPLIHLVLASFRSIETRRALIRSTNTGISAVVDPIGRVAKRTGQWTQETLVASVPLVETGETTIYMMAGDWLGWLALVLVASGLILSRRERRRTH